MAVSSYVEELVRRVFCREAWRTFVSKLVRSLVTLVFSRFSPLNFEVWAGRSDCLGSGSGAEDLCCQLLQGVGEQLCQCGTVG